MKIDGKAIADKIATNLTLRIKQLQAQDITPHIAILLVGDDPASEAYVKRKKIKAEELGGKATIHHFSTDVQPEEVLKLVSKLNHDKTVHGIIVQRPLPLNFDLKQINNAVTPEKDIDAFNKKTKFEMPLAKAAMVILEHVYDSSKNNDQTFDTWLKNKSIAVFGKGETGGGPMRELLKQKGITPTVIDSKTENPKEIARTADILISAVGKSNVITADMVKKDAILISIGLHKEDDGKLHGDYETAEIEQIASFYTPTPNGIGPVNVICLLTNLIKAAEIQSEK